MRILLPIIIVVAAVLVFITWTQPRFLDVQQSRLLEADYNNALANSRELQKIRDDFLSKYNSISPSDLDRLNKFLPSNMEAIKLIIQIESVARGRDVWLNRIDVEGVKSSSKSKFSVSGGGKYYNIVPLNMSVSGSYDNLLMFLSDLESSLHLFDVEEMNFNASEEPYEFRIRASTYWKNTYDQ